RRAATRHMRRTDAERRRDGHVLQLHRHRRKRATGAGRRRPVEQAGVADVPVPGRAAPRSTRPPGAHLVETASAATAEVTLELDDIQSGALHERPSPYVGRYLLLRIDDRAAGRELVRRLHPVVDASRDTDAARDAWATVAFTYSGLKQLGVP